MVTQEEIGKIFDSADSDGSGFLTPQEIKHMLINLNITVSEMNQIMREYDVNGDG